MTLLNKGPMARKEAWNCVCRCLAVMLCCVLVFGLTVRVTPRVQAAAAVGSVAQAVAASGAVPLNDLSGASAALLAMVALGVDVEDSKLQGTLETKIEIAERMGYKWGWQVDAYLRGDGVDDEIKSEWSALVDSFENNTMAPGSSFVLSPALASLIRQWAGQNMDFTDGKATYSRSGIVSGNGAVLFTSFPVGYKWNQVPIGSVAMGTVVPVGGSFSFTFNDYEGVPVTLEVYQQDYGGASSPSMLYKFVRNGSIIGNVSVSMGANPCFFHLREFQDKYYLCVGLEDKTTGFLQFTGEYWTKDVELGERYPRIAVDDISGVTTTITKTPALDAPVEKAVTVTLPSDLSFTDVGGISVPDIGSLTGEELTGEKAGEDTPAKNPAITVGEISQAVTDAIAGTKTEAKAVDQALAVENALAEPDSLGAVFISKFPFSIPWDVYKAIELLAAPPVTPYWEVDFMQPIAGRVGGFRGSTTIVIDFGRYPIVGIATRWTSTLLFVYALAMGTKKLIWTA